MSDDPNDIEATQANAVLAGRMRDPSNGRFLHGNQASRLRALKRRSELVTLNPSTCALWVRPFAEMAHKRASDLVTEAGAAASPSRTMLAELAASADAFAKAYMAIAVAPDSDAKTARAAAREARAWSREARQAIAALRNESRAPLPNDGDERDPWEPAEVDDA